MIKLEDKPTVYYDVDDTLVLWGTVDNCVKIVDGEWTHYLAPHEKHIEILKKDSKNCNVIVWSQAGSDWAEAVITALNLEEYVNAVVPKPIRFYDDLPCKYWMGSRVYYKTYFKEDTTKKAT